MRSCWAEWFHQKVDGAVFDRANRRRDVTVARDENDWRVVRVAKLSLEIQAIDVRQFHVQEEARRQIGLRIRDVLGGRSECDGRHVERCEQLTQRFTHANVIVHNIDDVVV
jgi:hypothetical protein